jgi:hypothetical protein
VLVLLHSGEWAIGSALGKVETASHQITDHDGAVISAHTKFVRMHQYEVLTAKADPLDHAYCLRRPAGPCDQMWAECGVGLKPTPCYKQHTQIYRLSALREPVNFAVDIPRQASAGRRRTARAPAGAGGRAVDAAPLRYFLSDLTKQQVRQGLAALPGL